MDDAISAMSGAMSGAGAPSMASKVDTVDTNTAKSKSKRHELGDSSPRQKKKSKVHADHPPKSSRIQKSQDSRSHHSSICVAPMVVKAGFVFVKDPTSTAESLITNSSMKKYSYFIIDQATDSTTARTYLSGIQALRRAYVLIFNIRMLGVLSSVYLMRKSKNKMNKNMGSKSSGSSSESSSSCTATKTCVQPVSICWQALSKPALQNVGPRCSAAIRAWEAELRELSREKEWGQKGKGGRIVSLGFLGK